MQGLRLLLLNSPFETAEALLKLLKDLGGGTGVVDVRAQRQPDDDDLVPCTVDGVKDIRDEQSGKTLQAFLSQLYLSHPVFRYRSYAISEW